MNVKRRQSGSRITLPPGMVNTNWVGMFASNSRRELGGHKPGQRNSAGLVGFRGAQDDTAANIGEGTTDIDAAAVATPGQQAWTARRCADTSGSGICGSWSGDFAGAGYRGLLAEDSNRSCA